MFPELSLDMNGCPIVEDMLVMVAWCRAVSFLIRGTISSPFWTFWEEGLVMLIEWLRYPAKTLLTSNFRKGSSASCVAFTMNKLKEPENRMQTMHNAVISDR